MRLTTFTLATATALGLFAASSNAALITFDSVAPGVTNVNPLAPYSEAGFTFTPINGLSATFGPGSPTSFPGDTSSGYFGFAAGNVITMTGPAPFDLASLDLGPLSFAVAPGTTDVTVTADVFGGGTVSQTFLGVATDTTETLNWTNLTDVMFLSDNNTGLDNISTEVTSTPEPGAMLLLGIGFGALVAMRRRSLSA